MEYIKAEKSLIEKVANACSTKESLIGNLLTP
jgi:hypothetical protein